MAFDAAVIQAYFGDHAQALVPATLAARSLSDPVAPPAGGVTAFVVLTDYRPAVGMAGLDRRAVQVQARIMFLHNMLAGTTTPADDTYPAAIDPLVMNAMHAYTGRIIGNLRPSDELRVDPYGAQGEPLGGPITYMKIGDRWYRAATLTVEVTWLDAWTEAD